MNLKKNVSFVSTSVYFSVMFSLQNKQKNSEKEGKIRRLSTKQKGRRYVKNI